MKNFLKMQLFNRIYRWQENFRIMVMRFQSPLVHIEPYLFDKLTTFSASNARLHFMG